MKHPRYSTGLAVAVLCLFAACGGPGTAGPSGSQSVQITETDFRITSSVTTFVPGQTYHFLVTNQGKTVHEFMIMPRSEGSMAGMPMGEMDHKALARIDHVNPGETKSLDYTFPSSAANSRPELACYLPGHYEAGMKLAVAVTASPA